MTSDTVKHLKILLENYTEESFESMDRGKPVAIQLFRFSKHIMRAFDLQFHFPEYFDPCQVDWFRRLMVLKQKYDWTSCRRRIEHRCKQRLEEKKRTVTKEGKSWKNVADAVRKNNSELEKVKVSVSVSVSVSVGVSVGVSVRVSVSEGSVYPIYSAPTLDLDTFSLPPPPPLPPILLLLLLPLLLGSQREV